MSTHELIQLIKQELLQYPDNLMSFSTYMSRCLYAPEYGYYRSSKPKVGREGDFYTSVQVGTIMAEMISKYMYKRCLERGWKWSDVIVVEWGAGTGRLASQLLLLCQSERTYPSRYVMIETSPYHRQQSCELLTSMGLYPNEKVVWWDEQKLKKYVQDQPVFIIANELLDAFPVERLRMANGHLEAALVGWNPEKEQFVECWKQAAPEHLSWMQTHQIPIRDGQIYEAHLAGAAWAKEIGSQLNEAEGIFIDYGDHSQELCAEHRMNGTLMCYYRHQAHDDPYMNVGVQDITSFVDFDVYGKAFAEAGCHVLPIKSQQQFLLDNGLLEELRQPIDLDPFSETAKRNRSIRQLLLSDHMSERFKVMHICK